MYSLLVELFSKLTAMTHRLLDYSLLSGHVRFLCYHSVMQEDLNLWLPSSSISPSTFQSHLQYLKDNEFKVVSMPQAIDILSGKKSCDERMVCITFDDGFRNNLTVAWPLIKAYGYTAHFFITADAIGKEEPYDWDSWTKGNEVALHVPNGIPNEAFPLSAEEIRVLHSEGATIGSHGMYHRDLTKLSYDELMHDLAESRKIFLDLIGHEVDTFAYPYGLFDQRVIGALQKTNYRWGFTVRAGRSRPDVGQDRYKISRFSSTKNGSLARLRIATSGGYDFIRLRDIFQS